MNTELKPGDRVILSLTFTMSDVFKAAIEWEGLAEACAGLRWACERGEMEYSLSPHPDAGREN